MKILLSILAVLIVHSFSAFARKPNIIIILADDMGYGDAGCFGSTDLKTPNLDQMAREGMRLTDFHSSGNVCSPTRAGLLTGRYQQRAGIPGVVNADPKVAAHHHGLQDVEITFAERLKAAGYATGIMGKWHVGYTKNYNPIRHGFDRFRGFVSGNIDYQSHYDRMGTYDWWDGDKLIQEEGYSTHLITKHALKFIEDHKEKPFCLYVAHEAVHSPWQGPDDPPERGPKKDRRKKTNKALALKQMMTEMDKGVGELLDQVKGLGLSEHTFVFFCSDNGPAGGSAGPLRGRKGSNWEGGHRVPAIAWWPGKIKPSTTSAALGITLDLMPTMLALAGVEASKTRPLDGISLLPILTEEKAGSERKLYWNGKAMRDGHWKLVLGGKGAAEKVGLYNLADDIGEKKNLAKKYPERLASMQKTLAAWATEVEHDATPQQKK